MSAPKGRRIAVIVAVVVLVILLGAAAAWVLVVDGSGDDGDVADDGGRGGSGDGAISLSLEPVEVLAGGQIETVQTGDVDGSPRLDGESDGVQVEVVGVEGGVAILVAAATDASGRYELELSGQRCGVPVEECTEDDLLPIEATIAVDVVPLGEQVLEDTFLTPAPDREVEVDGLHFVAEEIIAFAAPDVEFTSFSAAVDEWSASNDTVVVARHEPLRMIQLIAPDADLAALSELAAALGLLDDVRLASLNTLALPDEGPHSEFSSSEWSGSGTEKTGHLNVIGAPPAWEIAPERGDGVKVAVMDWGIFAGHDDLRDNLADDRSARVGLDRSRETGAHGTHVASIACGAANQTGTVGVAPSCDLVRVELSNASLTEVVDSLRVLAAEGVRVVNMSFSWGAYVRLGRCLPKVSDRVGATVPASWGDWNAALEHLNDEIGEPGILIVTSVGNECLPLGEPNRKTSATSLPNVIVTAAVDQEGRLAWFSGYSGEAVVPVAAGGTWTPEATHHGTGVWAATFEPMHEGTGESEATFDPTGQFLRSTHDGMAGTSMAAPAVAGTAALVASANPTLNAAQLKECIVEGARNGPTGVPGSGVNPSVPQYGETHNGARIDFPTVEQLSSTYIVDAVASVMCARKLPGAVNPIRPVTDVEGDSAVVMVLDVSGSMSGDPIEEAKEAVNRQVRSVEPGVLVGVRIYPAGNERDATGSCSAGLPLVEIGPNDPTTTSAIVRRLRASGDTPTAPALRAAAADLEALGVRSATIVLVSDGESNCGEDPCAVASELAGSGIDFTIPTIGFQISEAGREQLECIAVATGGTYADASDGDQLADQAARLSSPDLSLVVEAPESAPAGATITVTAEIASQGGATARDVQLELIMNRDEVTRLEAPLRRLGNLAPGDAATASWEFRTPLDLVDRDLDFEVRVLADNLPNVARVIDEQASSSSVSIVGDLAAIDLGGPLAGTSRVALLGDGFSSGEGAGDYRSDSDTEANACHRSPDTYGAAVWDERVVLACSGALVDHLMTDQEQEPAQLRQLIEEGPVDAALLTVGAADVGLLELLRHCATVDDCTQTAPTVVCDEGCEEFTSLSLVEHYVARGAGLKPQLADAYRAVDATVNQASRVAERNGRVAPVVVLGYPSVTPPDPTGSARCAGLFTPQELASIDWVVDSINTSARVAARELRDEGLPVFYVANTADAIGPENSICAPSTDSYVAGLDSLTEEGATSMGDITMPAQVPVDERHRNEQFHPNADGYRAMTASLVAWSLDGGAGRPDPDYVAASSPRLSDGIEQGDGVDLQAGSRAALTSGSDYTVSASGFAPLSTVAVRMAGSETLLGVGIADDAGAVTVPARLPQGFPLGEAVLSVTGAGPDGEILVVARAAEVEPPLPVWLWFALVITAMALVAGGVLMLIDRRRAGNPVDATSSQI